MSKSKSETVAPPLLSTDAEETVAAIHQGNVDALVVQGPNGPQVLMLQGGEEPYRVLVERMSDGAATIDAEGTILYANSRLAGMSGQPIKDLVGRSFKTLFSGAGPKLIPDSSVEAILTCKTGDELPVAVVASSLSVGDAEATLVTLSDLTVHRRAVETANAERFARSILEQATDAIVVLAQNGIITHASAMAEQVAAKTVVGRTFTEAFSIQVGKEAHAGVLNRFSAESLDSALAMKPFHGVEVRLKEDHLAERTFLLSAGPLLNDAKYSVGSIVTLTDITDRKRAEEQQTTMVAELNHRVKNILAIVQSVAIQTIRNSDSMETFGNTFTGRIQALATAHDILTQTRWIGIGLGELVGKVIAPYRTMEPAFSIDGPPILIPARSVMPLSMVLHEMATNASKYGALSGEKGSISIEWAINAERIITLRWREKGGPKVGKPKGAGFGTKLINRVIAFDLEGESSVDYTAGGVAWELKFPLKADISPDEVPRSATQPS